MDQYNSRMGILQPTGKSTALSELLTMGDRRRTKTRLKLSLVDGIDRSFTNHRPFNTSLLSFIVLSLVFLCNANVYCILIKCLYLDNSQFDMRPFQASPHQLMRRQDGHSHHQIPVLDIASIPRLSSNEPNLMPILTAPVPRGSSHSKPSFQRIRLNKPTSSAQRQPIPTPPPLLPPSNQFTFNESPINNFQRLAGFNHGQPKPLVQPQTFAQPMSSFPSLINDAPPPPPPPPPPSSPQRQSFRRVKPNSGSRRSKPKHSSPIPLPTRTIDVSSRRITSTNLALPSVHGQAVRGRGPVNAHDDDLRHKANALDNEDENEPSNPFFGNRVPSSSSSSTSDNGSQGDNGILLIESLSRNPITSSMFPSPQSSVHTTTTTTNGLIHTPTIPLTYYTTFTYFTTVLRGQHTAMLSREIVSSTTHLQPIDRSVVTAIEFNDGYIRPSKTLVPLGMKTKGQTTTIYNMGSRVQIFNDDLYKAKHYLTKYTYFYTFISDSNTRYSTRVEETTSKFGGNLATLAPSLASSIDSDGLLPIVPTKSATVALGSRANGRMTTVVNLALNNYIHFDNVKDVHLKISPTQVVSLDQTMSSTLAHQTNPLIASSFDESGSISSSPIGQIGSITSHNGHSTPQLNNDHILRSNSLIVSSNSADTFDMISRTSSPSRSRSSSAVSRRPIRVKVKPIRSKLATLSRVSSQVLSSSSSSVFILSPSVQYEDISSSQTISPIYTPTSVYSSSIVHPSRPSVTIELEPSSPKMESSVRSNELQSNTPILKPSKTSKSRLVVLTRLAGALNKWNPLYNSRVRVSSRKVFKSTSLFELSSMPMETSTVYETTTHTVPFTLGATTVFTTVEETNSLVDTTDVLTTSTLYSTFTYFATLFNGTQTMITPLEEIKTEYLTLREPMVITRTIMPNFDGASTLEPTQVITVPIETSTIENMKDASTVTDTYSTHTVLTHFITLFSGSKTILSSIEEIIDSSADHSKSSAINSESKQLDATLFNKEQMDKAVSSIMTMAFGPSTTLVNEEHSSSTTAVIEPGSVIELDDLLGGVQDAGQIGETIKDIVNNIVIRPETNPSDETTTSTNDAESQTDIPPTTTTSLAPSFNPSASGERTTPNLNSVKNRFPAYIASQNLPKYYMSSNEDKSLVIFSTQAADGDTSELPMSTRYVTSIEKSIKTLTLTSTKVYYTRDSPLTITSILTTTLPPVTYVSTIIGSKTILGTYNSITPTKTSSIDVSPTTTSSSSPVSPSTNRPRLHRPKNQEQPTLLKAKVVPFLNGKKISSTSPPTTISRNVTIGYESELQLCSPACNVTNKEHCKESESGRYSCECRPGYVRRPSDNMCQEIKNYLVMVRVSKTSENEVASAGNDLQSITRVARRQVGKKEGIAGLQVVSVERNSRNNGASMVNLTIQLDRVMPNVHDDLLKKLQSLGQVEKVVDFDECSSHIHNDCSPRARCINEPGSYRCQCLDNFINLDQSLPGRLCSSEMKSCEYCHGRGDCWKNQGNTVCRCHPMFIGRRCEINVLAILVPIVAILVIVAIVCFLYCSRKLRQRNRRFKNLSAYGPVAVIGGTLDRKAMLETSSESSDPQHRSSHYANESNPASARGSMARRNGSRRESEPSLDRSMASYSAAGSHYNSLPPQILIPRARPPYTIHPGQI
ncbi:hypothetical protein BLOT_013998 [Blomia tropicalis]|nr:hypothetical protein BLOT_013998 [Blomia tropicalis]